MERNIFAWGMTTRKAVFAKIPRAVFPVVGIYHMDYIEELFESIEIQLVFHRFPLVGVWPLSTPPMKSRLFLWDMMINIRCGKIDFASSSLSFRIFPD